MQILDGLFKKTPLTEEVSTKFGKVVGQKILEKGERAVNAFKGIPFAKPPIGHLRFKKPVAPDAWDGVLKATRFTNRCVQVDGLFTDRLKYGQCSEDCLYLNVFAPTPTHTAATSSEDDGEVNEAAQANDAEKETKDEAKRESGKEKDENVEDASQDEKQRDNQKQEETTQPPMETVAQPNEANDIVAPTPTQLYPVMVFIHGGSFATECANKYGDIGIAKHLVRECEVVVVTLQYRLGYLGFFSTGDLACDDNVGLWDMTMALQWVQDNIHNFHGDKNNVTLFGHSAGGAAVDLLSLSPHSRDLFHKVIPMGGCVDSEFAIKEDAVENCRLFAEKYGICMDDSEKAIEKLQKLSAQKFGVPVGFDAVGAKWRMQTEVGPRVDGHFFPHALQKLRAEAPKKKRLVGMCEHEGLSIHFLNPEGATLSKIREIIAARIPESKFPNFKKLRGDLLKLYNTTPESESEIPRANCEHIAISNFYTDIFVAKDIQANIAENLTVGNDSIYLYRFDYCNPKVFGPFGLLLPFKAATHGTELAYLFRVGLIFDYKFNEEDLKILRVMTKLWSNFAKFGDPNGSVETNSQPHFNFNWLPVTVENPDRFLAIKSQPEMLDNFQNGRSKFWLDLMRE